MYIIVSVNSHIYNKTAVVILMWELQLHFGYFNAEIPFLFRLFKRFNVGYPCRAQFAQHKQPFWMAFYEMLLFLAEA